MDNSKLNHTELSYESSAGIAKVNLVTGRLLYEHFDASVGLNTKNLSVSHIYNSYFELPSNINTYMGKNWKLDIQQYLYYNDNETDTYTYIDAKGIKHTFEHLSGSEYYDTSGMGLILNVQNSEKKITDLTGSEMYFEEDKLVKIKSNQGDEIIIEYDKLNKIVSVYNTKSSKERIEFEYISSNLTNIHVFYDNNLEYSMKYRYGIGGILLDISKVSKDNVEKIETMFKYNDNDLLTHSVAFLDKNGFSFEYDGDYKVSKVITGIGNIAEEISEEAEPLFYLGDDIYVGENNYLGETFNRRYYTLQEGMNELTANYITYNTNSADVTNELGVTLTYFLDTEGNNVSVLEKDGNNYNLLKENIGTKISLVGVEDANESENMINGESIYRYTSTNNLSFDNEKIIGITPGQYSFSFWLKLESILSNRYIYLDIYYENEEEPIYKSYVVNDKAINCWQQVIITEKIEKNISKVVLSFNGKDEGEIIYLTDLYVSSTDFKCLKLNNNIYLHDIKEIRVNNVKLSDYKYLTEKDMYLTCYNKTKKMSTILESEEDPINSNFVLYYNNGTKAYFTNSADLVVIKDCIQYTISCDSNMTFDYKNISVSADDKVEIERNISLLLNCSSEKIYEKCFCITYTTTVKVDENEENNIGYTACEYYDLLNRLILSKSNSKNNDENNDSIYQSFDYSGNTITKKVYKIVKKDDGTEEENVLYQTSESFVGDTKTYKEDTENVSKVKYDNVTGLPLSVTEYDKLKREYFYNSYNNLLEAVKLYGNNTNNRLNRFINSEGKVVKLMDGEHIYNYKYDELGRLYSVTTPNKIKLDSGEIKIDEDSNNEKTLFLENKEIITNDQNEKGVIVNQRNHGYVNTKKYDKYGDLEWETKNGYSIIYNYDGNGYNKRLSEVTVNNGNEEVENSIYPPDEKKIFFTCENMRVCDRMYEESPIYCYSNIKHNFEKKSTIYSIWDQRVPGLNAIVEENQKYQVYVVRDDLKEKILEYNCEVTNPDESYYVKGIKSTYKYDQFGRINGKIIDVKRYPDLVRYYYLEKDIIYDSEILPSGEKYYYIDKENEIKKLLIDYEYEYDKGNLKRIILKDLLSLNNSIEYLYDEFNRIKEEKNTIEGVIKKYYYNEYDNLKEIIIENIDDNTSISYSFTYNELNPDLLELCENNQNTYTNILYDGFGKIIKFTKNNIEHQLTWKVNKFLESVKTNDLEVSYKYDYLGRRISKAFSNGEKREYFYNGNLLVFENIYTNKYKINLTYLYDMDEIIGFTVYKETINNNSNLVDVYDNIPRNETYYYVKNVLGDITAIVTEDKIVSSYKYDAWGNHKVYDVTGNENNDPDFIGNINPFRYRGYYYDVETSLFWLSSRYYSPELCRFISPDDVSYLDPESVNGLNLYCYCGNDPINRCDPTGHSWESFWRGVGVVAIAAVAVAAIAVITVASGGTAAPILIGAGIGALTSAGISAIMQLGTEGTIDVGQLLVDTVVGGVMGAFGGSALGILGMGIAGAGTSFAGSVAGDLVAGKSINWGAAGVSAVAGFAFGLIGGAGAQNGKISMRADTLKNIKISKQKFASGKFTAERFAQSQRDLARVLAKRTTALNNYAIQQIYYGIYPSLITGIMGYPF